jgi:hypothetical protein
MLRFALLLATTAGFTYAVINGTDASPLKNGAIRMLAVVAPETACPFDRVLCLRRQESELREISKKTGDQAFDLLFERDKRSSELKAAEAAVAANAALLNAGRDVYARCAEASTIKWKGALYSPAEFKAQLQFLYEDEKPMLEGAVDREKKFAEQLEESIRENAKLRARVATELTLMPARIDAERHKVLAASFEHLVASIDQFTTTAKQQIKAAAVKMRTTKELLEAEPSKGEPTAQPKSRARNPDFERFMSGGHTQ